MDLLKLTGSFESFKLSIEQYIEEGSNFHKESVTDESELETFQNKIKEWEKRILDFLGTAFSNPSNYWKQEFYQAGGTPYRIPNARVDLRRLVEEQKARIYYKIEYLRFNLKILEVSDAVISPETVNLEERRKYSVSDKLSILLNKLYQLYDDDSYPIKGLLIGNGIFPTRSNEDYELGKMLEDRGFVEFSNFHVPAVKLTSEGALFIEEQREKSKPQRTSEQNNNDINENNMEDEVRVFISHGRSNLWQEVARFIEKKLEIDTVVLKEQTNRGRTIIEKLEQETEECNFAIIVMTAEDEQKDGTNRARQNVVHEIGFCQGAFGRENVLVLMQKGVEQFTNISGIVYEEFEGENIKSTFPRIQEEIEDFEEELLDEEE